MVGVKDKAVSMGKPQFASMPPQKMAVVYARGDPNVVLPEVMPALYSAVYTLKFSLKKQGREFKVEALRARWPDAHLLPKDQWLGIYGLPIPGDITTLTQKVPSVEVKVEEWEYGQVAQVVHIGPYTEEGPTIEALHNFIEENGYEIAGLHEEHYLTSPNAKVQKTLVLYPVKKR